MKDWQFNILFFTAVGGTVLLLIGGDIGLEKVQSPGAFTGVGVMLTYVLTQKLGSNGKKKKLKPKEEVDDDDSGSET